jgi:signal transduction histidine kinase
MPADSLYTEETGRMHLIWAPECLFRAKQAEEYKQSLETVTQEAGNMSAIIDQLLILARADAGKVQLVFEEVNLGELIRDLCDDVEVLCQQKDLELKLGKTPGFMVKG